MGIMVVKVEAEVEADVENYPVNNSQHTIKPRIREMDLLLNQIKKIVIIAEKRVTIRTIARNFLKRKIIFLYSL